MHMKKQKMIDDVSIFIDLDSADVLANYWRLKIKENGEPSFVAEVPPDAFS
jgi:4-alpha-glucanotransferase